nr:PREDICTED: craniofacial development protein 2-like [Bemisia tabaci]
MGDLNSRTGRRGNCKVVGPFGEDAVNDNGDRLIDICSQMEMKILNGFFQHKDIHKYTWVQPTRGLKSIIDYVIVRQATKLKVQQVRVYRGLSCGSDHHFLRADVAFPVKGSKDKQPMQQQQQRQGSQEQEVWYNIESLEHPSVKALYRQRLDEKLGDGSSGTTEEQYQFIKECIHSAAKEALGVYKPSHKDQRPYWWDREIEDEINLKRQKHQIFLSSKKAEDKVAYRKAQSKSALYQQESG